MPYLCARCSKENSLSKCSGCKTVYYCSTECQRLDWSSHKPQCYEPPPTAISRDRPPYEPPKLGKVADYRKLLEVAGQSTIMHEVMNRGLDPTLVCGCSPQEAYAMGSESGQMRDFWMLPTEKREPWVKKAHKHNEKARKFWADYFAPVSRERRYVDVVLDAILNIRLPNPDPDRKDDFLQNQVNANLLTSLFNHLNGFTPSQNTALLKIACHPFWLKPGDMFRLRLGAQTICSQGRPSHDFIDQLALRCLDKTTSLHELDNLLAGFVIYIQYIWPQIAGTRLLDTCFLLMAPGRGRRLTEDIVMKIIEIAEASPAAAKHLLPVITAACMGDTSPMLELLTLYEEFGVRIGPSVEHSTLPWLKEKAGKDVQVIRRITKLLMDEKKGRTGLSVHGIDIEGRSWTREEYEVMYEEVVERIGGEPN
ncbi:hypothetical protein BDZ89DRAFT_1062794 [Hymenopellis radicata]|nr:hypothetical protein BDZ89DRAFT_1062794 [Hymenopellis radicata]